MIKILTSLALTLSAAACLGDSDASSYVDETSHADIADHGLSALTGSDVETGGPKANTQCIPRKVCSTDDDCRNACPSGVPSCSIDPKEDPWPHLGAVPSFVQPTCHSWRAQPIK